MHTNIDSCIRVSTELGTVDLLAAQDDRLGAFCRVIPNGEGSEFLFSLLFDSGVGHEAVETQMKIVEEELETVRRLVES
jgi:hypothetical protein